jgi:valyl-tRNA synthetase
MPVTEADKHILAQLQTTIQVTTQALEEFHFHEAAQAIYQFTWHELADQYIEASKAQLKEAATSSSTQTILAYTLTTSLRLLHPFIPFITEHIWGLIYPDKVLALETWPNQQGVDK